MPDSADGDTTELERPLVVERIFPWGVLIGGGLFAVAIGIAAGSTIILNYQRVFEIVLDHYAATMGIPCAGLAALCLVVFLKSTNGPIEFDVFGMKFKGASGPIIMWILCFLAMVAAIHLLWDASLPRTIPASP
jgi:hypothetical protein